AARVGPAERSSSRIPRIKPRRPLIGSRKLPRRRGFPEEAGEQTSSAQILDPVTEEVPALDHGVDCQGSGGGYQQKPEDQPDEAEGAALEAAEQPPPLLPVVLLFDLLVGVGKVALPLAGLRAGDHAVGLVLEDRKLRQRHKTVLRIARNAGLEV